MGCGSSNDAKSYTKVDQSIWRGQLTVHLRSATIKKDFQLIGKMDPYVKINLGKQQKVSTVCEDGGQFPTWTKQSFTFNRTNEDDVLYIQMWNKNAIQSDDFIGEGGLAMTKVRKGTNNKIEAECEILGKQAQVGTIAFYLEFDLLPECKDHVEILAPDTTGQFILRPKRATLQRDTVFLFGSMSPVAVVKLGDEVQVSSANTDGGKNPKWGDQLILTRDSIASDTIIVECQNFNECDDNELIGVGFLSVTSALPKDAKPTKSIDLFFEGSYVGNLTLEMEFISDEPHKYGQVQQQQLQEQPQQQQQQQQQQPILAYQPPQLPQNGYAEFRFPNGDFYQGEWLNGQKNGNGKMHYRSGMYYEGQWLQDHFHGHGTLKVSGTTYTGQFIAGKKNGQGTIVWDGQLQKYVGEWQDNKYHGIGDWTHANGQTQKGEFSGGNRTRWIEDQPQIFIAAGRCLQQGGTLPSDNNEYLLTLNYNGWIQVIHQQSRQPVITINQFPTQPRPPFFLRLEMDGRLNAIDGNGQTYYCSRLPNSPMQGNPPFKLVMQNDGKVAIHDASQPVWFSH